MNYPLSIPTAVRAKVSHQRIGFVTNHRLNTSTETFQTQVVKKPGQMLRLGLNFPTFADAEARSMWAFLTKLNGQLGTFYYTPKDPIKGTKSGTITVSSYSTPIRDTLVFAGGSGTGCLLEGDWVQIGTQLVQILTQYNGGTQTVEVFPALRTNPGASEPVITTNPTGIFRLASSESGWDIDTSKRYGFAIDAVEAV